MPYILGVAGRPDLLTAHLRERRNRGACAGSLDHNSLRMSREVFVFQIPALLWRADEMDKKQRPPPLRLVAQRTTHFNKPSISPNPTPFEHVEGYEVQCSPQLTLSLQILEVRRWCCECAAREIVEPDAEGGVCRACEHCRCNECILLETIEAEKGGKLR
jgi:hypothetical protein